MNQLEKAAIKLVRARLLLRDRVPIEQTLDAARVPENVRAAATMLATRLGEILGVDVSHLRADDTLRSILEVYKQELPQVSSDEWPTRGVLSRSIQVHCYDIMYLLEDVSDRRAWRRAWTKLPERPTTEEQWIDLILGMMVGEFLNFFAPLLKGVERA